MSCALLALIAIQAAEPVTSAVLPLADGAIRWSAGSGYRLEFRGQPVFAANSSAYVLHDPGWTKQLYNSGRQPETATLETKGEQQILHLSYGAGVMTASQTLISGPGNRFALVCEYRHDAAEPAALQLGFAKPVESFFAGSAFEVTSGGKPLTGRIPEAYDKAQSRPFSNATAITVRSLLGTVTLTSSRPLTMYDYAKRYGTLWLGLDEPLPAGETRTLTIEGELSPPDMIIEGARITGLQLEPVIVDRRLDAVVTASRNAAGRARQAVIEVTAEAEQTARIEADLSVGEPRAVALTVPLMRLGRHTCRLLLLDAAGTELYRGPAMTVQAVAAMSVAPSRSLYLGERDGALIIEPRPELGQAALTVAATGGGIAAEANVKAGERNVLPFDAAALPEGETTLQVRLAAGEQTIDTVSVVVRRYPPKANAVPIDTRTGAMVIDGLPTIPVGWYVRYPATGLNAIEAPFGFTHMAPYRTSSTYIRDEATKAAMLEDLDRYAACGMRVHYDIRGICRMDNGPDKDALLRAEVEAVKDHPALLAWYLADEPELQNIPPENLDAAYKLVKSLDPYHPCSQVFARRSSAVDYLNGLDLLMADPYPIPNSPVTDVARATDDMVGFGGLQKAVWIVPQAFGGGEWWKREPSPAEGRVMSYLALIRGAAGLQYFIRDPGHIRPQPALLSELRTVAAEVAELNPALTSTLPRPQVTATPADIAVTARLTDDAVWVIAANPSPQPTAMGITIEGAPDQRAQVVFEQRRVDLDGDLLEDLIDGFGTRVYRIPLQIEDPGAGIAAGNLVVNPSFEDQHVPGSPDGYYLGGSPAPGASVRIESRFAHHGRHCLKVVSPPDGGYTLRPFPLTLVKDKTYRVSIWARSLAGEVPVRLSCSGLQAEPVVAQVGPEWQPIALTGVAPEDRGRGRAGAQISYRLEGPGTVWFDLLEMVEVTP